MSTALFLHGTTSAHDRLQQRFFNEQVRCGTKQNHAGKHNNNERYRVFVERKVNAKTEIEKTLITARWVM